MPGPMRGGGSPAKINPIVVPADTAAAQLEAAAAISTDTTEAVERLEQRVTELEDIVALLLEVVS